MSRTKSETISANNRSSITNQTRKHAGIDGRTAQGRRFRDLYLAFAEPYGGPDALSEAERALVRAAAAATIQAEVLQGRIVSGEDIDPRLLSNISNVQIRSLTQLRRTRAAAPVAAAEIDLSDYLAQKGAD